jgi:hypothetical protein
MSVSKGMMLFVFVFYVAMNNPPFIETWINLLPTGQTGKGKQISAINLWPPADLCRIFSFQSAVR